VQIIPLNLLRAVYQRRLVAVFGTYETARQDISASRDQEEQHLGAAFYRRLSPLTQQGTERVLHCPWGVW